MKNSIAETDIRAIPALIGQLYSIVRQLGKIAKRPFTPDGHLVGSIGEVVAADTYGLILEKCSNEGFDAKTTEGETVEIKLTGGSSVAVSSEAIPPLFLIVLRLNHATGFEEIYNGDFPITLWNAKPASKRKVKTFQIGELRKINPRHLPQVNSLNEFNKLFVESA